MTILNMALMHFALCMHILCPVSKSSEFSANEDSLKIIEKVYLHIDRDSYSTGDDIWFKAYLVDGSDLLLSANSSNLHVELISPKQKILESRIIKLTNGLGKGDFKITESLHSGHYSLRAYTNYMRNFDSRYFFNREITIINPADAGKIQRDSISYVKNKIETGFFPEGGSLVDNVMSVIAFKVTDATGKGCDISGEVYSSSGELVTAFKSTHKGIGKFSLIPVQGKEYTALLYDQSGDTIHTKLPQSFPEGMTLNVIKNKDRRLDVMIRTNSTTLDKVHDQDLLLIVSRLGITYKTVSFQMTSLNSHLVISTDDLPDGIYELTLMHQNNHSLCERLVFISNDKKSLLNIETNDSVYSQRDSVAVKITMADSSGYSNVAFLSFSAFNKLSTDVNNPFPSTISSWFLLQSDIRGDVEDPSYYFDPSNPERVNDLDLLLLTQGWRDFEWKYKLMDFKPESGFILSGRARRKFSDEPIKNSGINIGIFKAGKPLITYIPTDSSGKFHLEGLDFYGDAKIVASITGDKDKLKGLLIFDSLKYLPAPLQSKGNRKELLYSESIADNGITTGKSMPSYIQYAEFKRSVQKKYKLSDTINIGEVTITAKRQDKPESARARSERYLLTNLPDIEYKIVPETEIYNNLGFLLRNKFHISTGDDPSQSPFLPQLPIKAAGSEKGSPGLSLAASQKASGNFTYGVKRNPIVLLDGMEVGFEGISALPINWVERVDMLIPRNAEMIWGDRGKDGVISVITKSGYASTSRIMHSVNIKIKGFNEPRVFYSPKHHTSLEKDYKPDLRTTLYWEPDIQIENNKSVFLNYFNGDNPSKVSIMVEGITTSGIPVTGKAEYEIK